MSEDWTRPDAERVLALAINRWRSHGTYGAAVLEHTYSNGTEAEIAQNTAAHVMECGPMVRKVMEAGVRALADDPQFSRYIAALYLGDSPAIVAIEAEVRASYQPGPGTPEWAAAEAESAAQVDAIVDQMVMDLEARYS